MSKPARIYVLAGVVFVLVIVGLTIYESTEVDEAALCARASADPSVVLPTPIAARCKK